MDGFSVAALQHPQRDRFRILGWVALHPFQIGFVLLEGAWVLISLYVLLRPKKVVER
jgi:hypothetical protein